MKAIVVEGRKGGRIYTEQEDGTICPWGAVLIWEPPLRLVIAWQITPEWKFEPDLQRCSEVEILFTPVDDGTTLVELEHKNFGRHGGDFAGMRAMVANDQGGWGGLLLLFGAKAEETA